MKIDIFIVDLVVIAMVIIPIFIFLMLGRKETRELKKKFREEAKKFELNPDERDQWNKNILGLDRKKQKMLLVQKKGKTFSVEFIDLNQVKECKILQETKQVKVNGRMEEQLQRIELELKGNFGNDRLIPLYDLDESVYQDYELMHAKKWNSYINECLIKETMPKRAA